MTSSPISLKASDIIAIRRMYAPQAEAYLRERGHGEETIEQLRPTFGKNLQTIDHITVDRLRPLFLAIMRYKGVSYRKLGQLYGIAHSTAANLVGRIGDITPQEHIRFTDDQLRAFRQAFYDHADELRTMDVAAAAVRLDEIAVDYLDTEDIGNGEDSRRRSGAA